MDLYLVRHGLYKKAHQDVHEGLSDLGYVDMRNLAKFLTELAIFPEYILCSSKKRSWESADLLKRDSNLIQTEMLGEDREVEEVLSAIPKDAKSALLVGHLPSLKRISHHLGAKIHFEMGSIAYFKAGSLVWLLTPRIIRMAV